MPKKLTTEDFIQRAKEVHGDKFDYSKVKYISNRTKVCIICPIHGEFWQTPEEHYYHGCRLCSLKEQHKTQTFSKEEFVRRAKAVHGEKYNYTKVTYINSQTKVCIICNNCGATFFQIPTAHLRGNNCPYCSKHPYFNTNIFTEKAKIVHNNFYNYDKTEYKSANKKITITCPIHGDFYQTPRSHLSGSGCPVCGREKVVKAHRYTNEIFIRMSKEIHGDKYTYNKVNYINGATKVCITCPKHGDFLQTPNSHLNGNGCPSCKRSIGEERITIYLIKNNISFIPQYMIQNEDLFCSNKKIYADFYIPSVNTIIEFNGYQHYAPVKHFIKHRTFENQVNRDNSLRLYCKDHNIHLIEIPYHELNRIEDILNKKLKGKRRKPNPQP